MTKKATKKKVAKKATGRPAGQKLRAFVFAGDGDSDPSMIHMMGYTFKLNGKPVKVSSEAAAKLENNGHFVEAT